MRAMPKVKGVRKELEIFNRKAIKHNQRSVGITKFTQNIKLFRKFIYGVIYSNDKICMVSLRDMLNMKMLSDFVRQAYNYVSKSDMKDWPELWSGSTKKLSQMRCQSVEEIDASKTNSIFASRTSGTLNQFFEIFGKEKHSREQLKNSDNRSQFSDFSLKFNQVRKTNHELELFYF